MRASWITRFRQDASAGPPDSGGGKLGHRVIVTEQRADPVELVYHAFRRLDAEQRRRLLLRIGRA